MTATLLIIVTIAFLLACAGWFVTGVKLSLERQDNRWLRRLLDGCGFVLRYDKDRRVWGIYGHGVEYYPPENETQLERGEI